MYRERHAGSCKRTNEDGWIKTTYTSMQIGAVWNEVGSLIHLCIQRCNGYKISLNSRKITLAITKHKAPCSSASKSGEESRAAIQMLLLERRLFAARQLGPSGTLRAQGAAGSCAGAAGEGRPGTACAAGAVPAGDGSYGIDHTCQYPLDFSAICSSIA